MRRFSHIMRWPRLFFVIAFLGSLLLATGSAEAVVVGNNQNQELGVALVPGTGGQLATAGVPVVTSGGSCQDPQLAGTPDLGTALPTGSLCLHDLNAGDGDSVLPKNETFAVSWDPNRWGWGTTRGDLEQFLRDIADGSSSTPQLAQMTSPFSLTSQYTDALGHRAAYDSKYGGACIDLGNPGGYTCRFGTTNGSGVGNNYPAGDPTQNCTASGSAAVCITDAAVQQEVRYFASTTQLPSYTQPGYSPVFVMLTPPGVEVCTDSTGNLCSSNGASTAQFCSYHGYLTANGAKIPYVVQPWTRMTGCDEPQLPTLPNNPTTVQVENDAAVRLESPLSAGLISAIVNPWLNGWFAQDGSEIDDNPYLSVDACRPESNKVDTETVGSNSYILQGEFNNGSSLSLDLNALPCPQWAVLIPSFVVPSAVNAGDVVAIDGSVTNSNEVVPKLDYWWSFGDGSSAIGPSVVHTYAKGGVYTITLTTIDRGGHVQQLQQQITVLGPSTGGGNGGGNGNGGNGSHGGSKLQVGLAFPPQSFAKFLRSGLAVNVTSNTRADGIIRLVISRRAAKRAHLKIGNAQWLVIGQGTVGGLIKAGKVTLHIHLSHATVTKLRKLGVLTVTVKLTLHAPGYATQTFDQPASLQQF